MVKRGRPLKEEAKTGQYRLRTSVEDEAMLDYIINRTGQSKAEILRKGLKHIYGLEKAREILDSQ